MRSLERTVCCGRRDGGSEGDGGGLALGLAGTVVLEGCGVEAMIARVEEGAGVRELGVSLRCLSEKSRN